MNLANDIAFLLYKHNCVIVPGFGAFLVNEKKAELNLTAKYAYPRSKTISFNAQIKNNDGLLANHLSNTYDYSYENGLVEIRNYVQELNDKLQDKRNAEVSEIGTFYLTKEEKLIFVPYHSVNFEMQSYGLPKLRLKTLQATESPTINPINQITPKAERPIFSPIVKTEEKKVERLEVQEKKRAIKLEQSEDISKDRSKSLSWINILGSMLVLALAIGIIYFELTNKSTKPKNFANLIDTPTTTSNNMKSKDEIESPLKVEVNTKETLKETIKEAPEVKEKAKPLEDKYKLKLFAVCTEPQADTFAAEKLKVELMPQFEGAFVWKENNNYRVQIIAISKEKVAKEFRDMAQKKVKQKLVIKQK